MAMTSTPDRGRSNSRSPRGGRPSHGTHEQALDRDRPVARLQRCPFRPRRALPERSFRPRPNVASHSPLGEVLDSSIVRCHDRQPVPLPRAPVGAELPADLLHALAECQGRVVLVIGAGCSTEPPTGLKLSSEYAVEVMRELVLDGVLDDGDCDDSEDLSVVTSAVWGRHGTQAPVVERLPHGEFRTARPNDGHLIAAALLREGAISCVL